jgi:hypothetical protein
MGRSSASFERIISQAIAIEAEEAQEAGALGYMARAMIQATLPHRKVVGHTFERSNGNYTLSIIANPRIGLPYGSMPRLLLSWVTTEAVRTRSRELVLGDSLSGFMRELGLIPTGGRWGTITTLKNQSTRLFGSVFQAYYSDKENRESAILNKTIVDGAHFWWDHQNPEQLGMWNSVIKLSEQFFDEVIHHPIPIDMRAIKALKGSALALDIYSWLTYRASYLTHQTEIPWEVLSLQFGANYNRLRDFKAAFCAELRKVLLLYNEAHANVTDTGILLKPAKPHILGRTK